MEPPKKVVSPVAINALSEALTNIYWYKPNIRNFLTQTISDPNIVTKLNWGEYKRNIVSALVNFLAKHQDTYKNDLINLMMEVCKMNDFSHLEQLDGGKEKAMKAKQMVEALRKQLAGHKDIVEEQEKRKERQQSVLEKTIKVKDVEKQLEKIKKDFFQLVASNDPHARGYKLEIIIKDLFTLFDLDPKASFKIQGEQIDGAFTFESNDYLFEGKWQKELCSIQDLDAFSGKLGRKLDNTLGLFCAINGFSEDAVKAHSTGRRLMILMDGSDLMAVLEGRIDLLQLLRRKRRHASQTGNIYLKIHEIVMG